MENKRKAGLQFQAWIKKYLEDHNWEVENFTPMTIKRIHPGNNKVFWQRIRFDPFDIDLIAKKIGEPTLWIQATLDSSLGRKMEKLSSHPWHPEHDQVEVWAKREPGKIDVFRLVSWGKFELVGKIIRRKHFKVEVY